MRKLMGHFNSYMGGFMGEEGLSFIELITALALLAIATTIVLPWYGQYQRRATVIEGVGIANEGKVQAAEMVTLGQVSVGIPEERPMYRDDDPNAAVIARWPTSTIQAVLRVGTAVIVTFPNKLQPSVTGKPYSIVLWASRQSAEGSLSWRCLSGDAATKKLVQAYNYFPDSTLIGEPLPSELAPTDCH